MRENIAREIHMTHSTSPFCGIRFAAAAGSIIGSLLCLDRSHTPAANPNPYPLLLP
jgi:hypothetical protein